MGNNWTNKSSIRVTLKQERVRTSVCARGIHAEGQEREEEKGNRADTPRSANAPGREGFCFSPSPVGGGALWLSPSHIQTEPLGKRGLFWIQEDKGLTQTRKGKKAKSFLLDTKYFL